MGSTTSNSARSPAMEPVRRSPSWMPTTTPPWSTPHRQITARAIWPSSIRHSACPTRQASRRSTSSAIQPIYRARILQEPEAPAGTGSTRKPWTWSGPTPSPPRRTSSSSRLTPAPRVTSTTPLPPRPTCMVSQPSRSVGALPSTPMSRAGIRSSRRRAATKALPSWLPRAMEVLQASTRPLHRMSWPRAAQA